MSMILCAAMTLCPAPLQDQVDQPDAEQLLAEVRELLGQERLSEVKSVTAHGRVTWEGLEEGGGLITEVYAGLRKARLTTDFGPFGMFEQGADGGIVWERDPLETKVREGWVGSEYLRSYGIAQHVDWREMYSKAWVVGIEEIGGHRCWEVQLAPLPLLPVGDAKEIPPPDQWFIDVETKLPRRYVAKSIGLLDEPVMMRIEPDDWRVVDGVRYPHRVELSFSGFTMAVDYDSYQHDVDLPEDFFQVDEDVLAAREDRASGAARERDERIVVEQLEERHLASIRTKCAHADMQKTLAVLLPEVMQHVISSGATMNGPPLVIYHDWGEPIDLETAVPVKAPIPEKGRVKPSRLPAGPAVVAWHVGPYEQLGRTHERIEKYMAEQGLEQRAPAWEEYWTDPGMEPDPSKWRTKIVMPVREQRR